MPDFFARVDALGVVEQHIKDVLDLEESDAKRLLRRYREVRHELRDRLDHLRGDTFSAQQLRGVMTQVDAAIAAMSSSLKDGMSDAAPGAALKGVKHQLQELKAFQREFEGAVVPINLNAQLVADDTSNFLINRYEASIDAYSSDLRSSLVQQLTTESLAQSPLSKIVQRLGQFFQGEEWKLHRIARTELHNVYNMGKMNGMLETRERVLPDLMKTLIHPMDSRTGADSRHVARKDLVVPLDEPFRYTWKGKERVYMAPPDRPNDRSILVPYRQAWES